MDIVVPPLLAIVAAAALTHVPPTSGAGAMRRPAGNVSTMPRSLRDMAPALLVTVNRSCVVPPGPITLGVNAFPKVATLIA